MIRTLRIAHTSDVHLHDGDDGQHVRDAFARVIDTVLDVRSDLFLIAGDLPTSASIKRVKGREATLIR